MNILLFISIGYFFVMYRGNCYIFWMPLFDSESNVHILAQPEHPFWINLNTYSETN